MPRLSRGIFAVPGVVASDGDVYRSEDGSPLLTAAQAEVTLGIRQRTVYEWRRRSYLEVRGLTEDGRELYGAAELAKVKANPGRREKVAA